MVDIFISYSREDRPKAKRLAEALQARGWIVWWDTRLRAGEIWDDTIEKKIKAARAAVVLWSKSSVTSHWVKNEARVANKLGTMVPALLQEVEPPVEYSHVHAADLIGWEGDRFHSGFQQLLDDLSVVLGPRNDGVLKPAPASVEPSVHAEMTEGPQPLHPDPTSRYAGERSSAPPSRSAVFLFTIVGIAFMLSAVTTSYYGHRAPERTRGSTSTASKTPPAVSSTPLPHHCKQCPEMLKIQSGEFLMGSPPDEEGRPANERPQHRVAIREFAIGKYEVTRGEYAHFVDKQKYEASEDGCYVYPVGKPETKDTSKTWRTPGFEQSDRDPVVCVSWKDAKAYVDWLSRETQEPYRLLTEAEWEYVARAGVETPYPSGAKTSCGDGNFQNCVGKTTPVDRYPPNRWGIYGMLGNAWEWVGDDWHPNFEGAPADGSAWNGDAQDLGVWRGGSWGSEAKDVLLTTRRPQHRDHPSYKAGFRVAKTL